MPICLIDPSALCCVCGQVLGVDALGCKDSQVSGVGVEAGAVFADVGVRAGALRGCSQAVAAGVSLLCGTARGFQEVFNDVFAVASAGGVWKDMIISCGENIYCAKVENVLAPIGEVAVIGSPARQVGRGSRRDHGVGRVRAAETGWPILTNSSPRSWPGTST